MIGRESPVARFVAVTLLLLALVLFAALGTIDHLSERARLEAELATSARVGADQLAASLALPVWNFDEPQIDKIAQSMLHDREAAGIIIRMNDVSVGSGIRTLGLVRDDTGGTREIKTDVAAPAGCVVEERPLLVNGEPVGLVKIFYTPFFMQQSLRNHLFYQVAIFLAFGIILTAGLYLLLWRTILRPLGLIEQYAGQVSSGGDATPAAGGRFRGELERLRASIQKMVALLAARYASLKQNEARLADQLQFETLVAGINSQLVAARPDNLQPILANSLGALARLLNADRVVLGRTEDATGEMIARAHFCRTEPPFPPRLVISERYPAMWGELRQGRTSHIGDVAELGATAELDRKHFYEVGIRTQVTTPVFVDGRLQYLLAVATVGRLADWSEEAVARIKVIAEVLATTALRCEAEEIVRSSERQFRTFIEQAPVPIILVPSPDRSPIYFNPAFTRTFGYTREDVQRPEDLWPLIFPDPDYRTGMYAAWEKIVARAGESGDFQDTNESEMHTKSDDIRFAQVRITMVEGYRMSFINDLTARRAAETALRLTQYAVDHNPVMMYRIDMDGRFVYANDAACAQLGYTPAELLQLHIWDVARTSTREEWPTRSALVRENGGANIESVFVTRTGDSFPVEVRIQFVSFSGQQHFFAYAIDITDRKAAQAAQHAYTRRVQMLATELTRAEERQRRELATILHDGVGQNLFAATTQLLTVRAREAGTQPEVDKALSLLEQITRDTRELTFELCPPVLYQLGLIPALQRLADQFAVRYQITCTVSGTIAGPVDLTARGLAYQAVRELLNNVAKHAGARHVDVSGREVEGHAELEVADDGVGFDPARPQAVAGGARNGGDGGRGQASGSTTCGSGWNSWGGI